MRMATQLHSLQVIGFIDLVSSAQLVVPDDLRVGDLFPPGLTEKMLGLDSLVAQEAGVRNHGHEVICGHVVPFFQADFGVVNRQGWGDDAAEAVPVLEPC